MSEPSSKPTANEELSAASLTVSDLGSVSILLRAAKRGCSSSRQQLLKRFQDYLSRLAGKQRDDRIAAKVGVSDIVQQSLLKADTNFEAFRGKHEGQWKAWLKMLLINEVRQTTRHFSRDKRSIVREVSPAMDPDQGAPRPELDAAVATPLDDIIRKEQLTQLAAAIERLSDDHRTVIQLRSMQRKSMAEVAQQMNRSVDATAKLWYRAIQKLRTMMPDVEQAI